ncbi:hypothetical protein ASA1KI_02240 [Opitutales bacterium ASA1]|uniref:hypothetical protein n=1 Tax=Congregicoccus parvus TaxID=3081749 RepID=UPI002B2EA646|nr:hypothetical protein ASA1KI_02240 [Opitutales bacterium ASA1]
MNRRTRRIARIATFAALAITAAHAHAESRDEVLGYLHRTRPNVPAHEYYILMAQPETVGQLVDFLTETGDHFDMTYALNALAAIGSVDKTSVPFDTLERVARLFEERYDPKDPHASALLERAYWAVAHYGTDESLRFLIERGEADSWRGGPMPEDRTRVFSDGTIIPANPATLAAVSLRWDGSPESLRYRDEYLDRNRHSDDPAIQWARRRLESARFSLSSGRRIQEAAWALKQRGFRLDEDGRFVPLDDADKPPLASASASAPPEAPVHEPTQTAPSKDTTEDASALSPRLPLAVSAVLALAAIAWLALRHRGS